MIKVTKILIIIIIVIVIIIIIINNDVNTNKCDEIMILTSL